MLAAVTPLYPEQSQNPEFRLRRVGGSIDHAFLGRLPLVLSAQTVSPTVMACELSFPSLAMDAEQTEALIADTMSGLVEATDSSELRRGLRKLTYPNSREMKRSKRLDKNKNAKSHLKHMRPDILGLVTVLGDTGINMTSAEVDVYDEDEARLIARDSLLDLQPDRIRSLCNDLGMPIDYLGLWRRKGGAGNPKRINLGDLDDVGADSELLRRKVMLKEFIVKAILTRASTSLAYIPTSQVPDSPIARDALFVDLRRQLSYRRPDKMGDRWLLNFCSEAPKQIVVPKLSFTLEQDTRYPYFSPYMRQAYPERQPLYNPRENTITRPNSLLASLILAGQDSPLAPVPQRIFPGRPSWSFHEDLDALTSITSPKAAAKQIGGLPPYVAGLFPVPLAADLARHGMHVGMRIHGMILCI